MPIIIPWEEAPQGEEKWMAIKLGKPSSSNFGNIVKANGDRSESRTAYLEKLADEVITERRENQYELSSFRRGKELEPESRETFEFSTGVHVKQVSLVWPDERKRYLCSPDGLIDDDSGFETKSANIKIQLKRLRKGTLPPEHHRQVQGCLMITERDKWHYRSYCRGMRPLNIVVRRDEKFIRILRIELEAFCDDLEAFVEECRNA